MRALDKSMTVELKNSLNKAFEYYLKKWHKDVYLDNP